MEQYDRLYTLYDDFDTERLRDHQDFVGVFPPVDSRVTLQYWQEARDELDALKDDIREGFPGVGETFADIAAHATRDQAFTALDLLEKYDRGVNVLVLDIDETLRSAGNTDNEIPLETLRLLTELHERGVPLIICTGQTLENVKGLVIQGLGNELVHSGNFSIVYEAGSGVFTPGHGAETKRLLYDDLDPLIQRVFEHVRSQVFADPPERIRTGCHLQGNEFNVTLKPNFETGSRRAREVVDRALVYHLSLLGDAVATQVDCEGEPIEWTRAYYADADPEIRAVLESADAVADLDPSDVPGAVEEVLDRIDVAYYEGDAAEIGSSELNKVLGTKAALEVLGVDDPFAFVMGDSKSDLRVMEWVAEDDAGISAAPEHATEAVLDHVHGTDGLVFDRGDAAEPLRVVYALDCLARVR